MTSRYTARLVLLVILLVVAYFSGDLGRFQPAPQANVANRRDSIHLDKRGNDDNVGVADRRGDSGSRNASDEGRASGGNRIDQTLARAFENHSRNVEVEGSGRVVRLLRDDDEGIEHQKFILRLASGQELLVAHNTDLAGRLDGLRVGDTVEFHGEYEWNPQGGVVHWTHRDPHH